MRQFVLAVLMLVSAALAATELQFEALNTADGLPQATATAITQDRDGFMWFGTQDGLSRYDGHRFRNYKVDRAVEGGLSDNFIGTLYAAADGALWIGTRAGIVDRYDPRSDRFFAYKLTPATALVLALLEDRNGVIWVGTDQGIYRKHPADDRFEPVAKPVTVSNLLLTKAGLMLAVTPQGVVRLNVEGELVPFADFSDALVIAERRDGDLWLGLKNGEIVQLEASGAFKARFGINSGLQQAPLAALLVDRSNQLWVASHVGLARLDTETMRFESWRHDPGDALGLSATRLQSLFEDRSGVLWIGTWTAGVNRLSPANSRFENVRYRSDDTGLPSNSIRALKFANDGTLYLAALDGVGLLKRTQSRRFERFTAKDGSKPFTGMLLQTLAQDSTGILWVGTRGNGLIRVDLVQRTVREINPANSALPNTEVYCSLYDAQRDILWLGTRGGGLVKFDPSSEAMKVYTTVDGLSSDRIFSLNTSRSGLLVIGTEGAGLNVLDPNAEPLAVTIYRRDDEQPGRISHNTVTAFAEDPRGGWWLGTQGGGINYAAPATLAARTFERIGSEQGLNSDAIGELALTAQGTLWASTTVGLSEIDTTTRAVKNYSQEDGVQGLGYYIGAAARDNQGGIYFGGLQGYTHVLPEIRWTDTSVASAQIVSIEVNRQALLPGWRRTPAGSALAVPYLKQLVLPPDSDNLQLNFSALDFTNPKRNQFRYRLLGFDRDWQLAPPSQPYALYSRLPAGSYTFELLASNTVGEFATTPRRLAIVQAPVWWWSTWARVGYVVALLLLLALYLLQRPRQRAREEQARQQNNAAEERLKLALWGSGDELWDMDLKQQTVRRENCLPQLQVNHDIPVLGSLKDYMPYTHPADVGRFNEAFLAHLKGETPAFELRFRAAKLGGGWTWLLVRGRSVARDANARVTRLAGTMRSIDTSVAIEEELRGLNDALETRVAERTEELEETLNQLQSMQSQLVQSEKMASLGGLVAGVAHEINTPIGVSVTAASHLEEETRRLKSAIADGQMTRSALDGYLETADESSNLILRNLKRAAGLIRSFKQVAVDQSSEARRVFNLREYLEEILTSLNPELKRTKHQVVLDVPPDIELKSYPGALTQVIVNLTMNSLIHGFEGIEAGLITIRARANAQTVALTFTDNGIGLEPVVRARIFDPFFTTKRGQGGSGLGMHIVYNLVTGVLGGSIQAGGIEGHGIEVLMSLPLVSAERANP